MLYEVITKHIPGCDLHVIRAEGWRRNSLYGETGLPWVIPSPNMPTPQTTLVYPGTVLTEALNLSEGRGTVIPFELQGAPFINSRITSYNVCYTKLLRFRLQKQMTFRGHHPAVPLRCLKISAILYDNLELISQSPDSFKGWLV